MPNFIVLDLDDIDDELFAEVYNENDFLKATNTNPLEYKEFINERERINAIVTASGYRVAWSRKEAADKIIQEITLLSLNTRDEWRLLTNYAKLLKEVATNKSWEMLDK